jgi:hypothetical protein
MRFLLIFFSVSVLLATSLYGLIIAVDPYNKMGNNLFNLETKAVDFARENKFNQVEHSKKDYNLFVMGSSSAHRYETSKINELTNLVSYNYSTQSATPEDYISMTRHILTKYHPKIIMISFDFEALSKSTATDDMFYSSPLKKYLTESPEDSSNNLFNNSYLTLKALSDTFQVIWVNKFGKAAHTYLEDGNHIREATPKSLVIKQFGYPNYELDQKRINYLNTIQELSNKHGFKVIAFTSPLSYDHLQLIKEDPHLARKHEEFKTALVEIFGELYDFQNEGIKPYNSVEFFSDSNHPNHDFSSLVLERIFGTEDPSNHLFGIKLSN